MRPPQISHNGQDRNWGGGLTFGENTELLWREIVNLADFRFEIFYETRVTGNLFRIMMHSPKTNPPRGGTKDIYVPGIVSTLPN